MPTRRGKDLENRDRTLDAHIRKERVTGEWFVTVDVFRSTVKDPDQAHLESEAYPWTRKGLRDAEEFLRDRGFEVSLRTRR